MSSLFSRGTKSLVRELGRKGELVPVDSLASALWLRPFCLVRKKHRRHLWPWDAPLIPTDFSLVDALEPGSPIPEVSRSEPIHLREMVAGAVTGGVSVGTGLQGSVAGSGVGSPQHLGDAGGEEETEHSEALVPQGAAEPQGEGEPVCGDEAVEATEDATLQSLSRGDGAGRLSLLRPSRFKLQGQSAMAKEKTVAIPRGTVLASRVLQLVMEEDHWAVLYLPEGKLWRDSSGGAASGWAPGEEPDFRGLQRQARAQLQDLATLPPELRDPLLGALQELLQDPWALQELEDTLERALDTGVLGQLGGPGGLLLSILRDPSGSLSPSKGRAILCILGAPVVLSDTQHCLERGVLPQRLELGRTWGEPGEGVASILEADFNQMEETTFSLPPAVLSSLQSEDVALTRSLVEGWLQLLAAPGPAALWADA
ncbi:hypothetical protein J1605_007541 [Eschrichtius robustus]|uniref:Gasdermin-D n=1 Tax=Eschrichtius robustus TaxID=9764 RepID=A0AB34H261_ESCRO|nr:hypothetical protein J1605_007541 [Eschrichtius robustus]